MVHTEKDCGEAFVVHRGDYVCHSSLEGGWFRLYLFAVHYGCCGPIDLQLLNALI